jgi:hypothetical protein
MYYVIGVAKRTQNTTFTPIVYIITYTTGEKCSLQGYSYSIWAVKGKAVTAMAVTVMTVTHLCCFATPCFAFKHNHLYNMHTCGYDHECAQMLHWYILHAIMAHHHAHLLAALSTESLLVDNAE